MLRKIFVILVVVVNLCPISFVAASTIDLWGGADAQFEAVGFDADLNPQATIIGVIKLLLSFLGIVAVILILWAGWLWMTAGGNEDNVRKAKEIMIAAVIGLVIILSAYGIVVWVLDKIVSLV